MLSLQSTARAVHVWKDFLGGNPPLYRFTPTRRSYYNFVTHGGQYQIPGLNLYSGQFIAQQMNVADNPPRQGPPQNPPDSRTVDDQGDDVRQNVPQWLDIYFLESDPLIGADPRVVSAFGRPDTWDDIAPNAPVIPIRVKAP